MIKKYNKLKNENEQNVVIIKSGMFYNAFHEDAVIIIICVYHLLIRVYP